eukprot:1987520-Prymnesium_polylepis.1
MAASAIDGSSARAARSCVSASCERGAPGACESARPRREEREVGAPVGVAAHGEHGVHAEQRQQRRASQRVERAARRAAHRCRQVQRPR